MTITTEQLNFLVNKARVAEVRHSGRTLFAHLHGTHSLLRSWGARPEVCLAGLFHSIYGTRAFKHKSWPLTERHVVRDLIGREAEWLAYLFCATARPKAFVEAAEINKPAIITDLFRNMELLLTPAELKDLLEIEAANLIEQDSRSRRLLKRLRDSGISVAAQAAITGHISKHADLPGGPQSVVEPVTRDRPEALDLGLSDGHLRRDAADRAN
jgi:hypothetical protein